MNRTKTLAIIIGVLLVLTLNPLFTIVEEVKADEIWNSCSFGGSVTVIGEPGEGWHSSSFGGSVTISGWSDWSEYWKIGQTIIYDCNTDLKVDTDDINITISNLSLTGDPGWISADINSDGVIDYLDIGGVCFYYPWDYSS